MEQNKKLFIDLGKTEQNHTPNQSQYGTPMTKKNFKQQQQLQQNLAASNTPKSGGWTSKSSKFKQQFQEKARDLYQLPQKTPILKGKTESEQPKISNFSQQPSQLAKKSESDNQQQQSSQQFQRGNNKKHTTRIQEKTKTKKKEKSKAIKDYILPDVNGRNMLHRQALQQNAKTVQSTILQYIQISKPLIEQQNQKKKLEKEKQEKQQEKLEMGFSDEEDDEENQKSCIDTRKCCRTCKSLICCRTKDGKTCASRLTEKIHKHNPFGRFEQFILGSTEIKEIHDYINQVDSFDFTAVLMACIKDYSQMDQIKQDQIAEQNQQQENQKQKNQNKQKTHKEIEKEQKKLKDQIEHNRLETLKHLIRFGGQIDIVNQRTLWTPFHWLAYHKDKECLEFLLNIKDFYAELDKLDEDDDDYFRGFDQLRNNIKDQQQLYIYTVEQYRLKQDCHNEFLPDYTGKFPIDLAGQKKDDKIVELLLDRTYQIIHNKVEVRPEIKRFLQSPLYLHRCLFWACQSKSIEKKKIAQFLTLIQDHGLNIYIEAPLYNQHNLTPIQAVCENTKRDQQILNYFLTKQIQGNTQFMERLDGIAQSTQKDKFGFYIKDNTILNLDKTIFPLDTKFKKVFIQQIQAFAEWEFKYIKNVGLKGSKRWKNYLDHVDSFGNTALHLACINGSRVSAEYLIQRRFNAQGANIDIENQEGWRPKDLINHNSIKELFKNEIGENQIDLVQLNNIKQLEKEIKKDCDLQDISQGTPETNNLFKYGQNIFIPDFVIKFKIEYKKEQNLTFNQKMKDLQGNDIFIDGGQANRMNNYLKLLVENKFQTSLLKGIEPGIYYILISCREDILENLCHELQIPMKLLDSYDYQIYELKHKDKFEPFRSKQRQQIIETKIKENIPLNDMKTSKLIIQFYKMHTYAGLAKIKKEWINSGLIPYPLNSMGQYLRKGQGENFSALTFMRQYLGEKISFFFAWKSYLTCGLVFLAVPGLAFQIYIIWTDQWNHWLLPIWVFYVTIWNTVIVEYWKRKTSEINYRWGALNLVSNTQIQKKKVIRHDFVGDDCISRVTGELTKHQEITKTWGMFALSLPLLVILMSLVVITFLGVEYYKQSNDSWIHQMIAGGLQGVSIVILNLIYQFVVNKFAQLENHKFEEDYEYYMIYKQILFKLLNSFFSIFYIAFESVFQTTHINSSSADTMFQTLFFMLLPIMLIKQFNYMLMQQWIPMIIYKLKEKNYFKMVNLAYLHKKKTIEEKIQQEKQKEKKTQKNNDSSKNSDNLFNNEYSSAEEINIKREQTQQICKKNQIEIFYKKEDGRYLESASRAVLGLNKYSKLFKSVKSTHQKQIELAKTTENPNESKVQKENEKENVKKNVKFQTDNPADVNDIKIQEKKINGAIGSENVNFEDDGSQRNHLIINQAQIINCEVDSIELNSKRNEFTNMIQHYADGFVDLGYISLFAAAFPLGPVVSLIANILEIRAKIYVFMYVYQRPTCQNCNGIGEWLNIWENMSFASVYTNFALLYFHETDLFTQLFGTDNRLDTDETQKLWFFLFVIIVLIVIRKLVAHFIVDKPPWIINEEERRNYEFNKKREEEEFISKQSKKAFLILQSQQNEKKKEQMEKQNKELRKLEQENKHLEQQIKLFKEKIPAIQQAKLQAFIDTNNQQDKIKDLQTEFDLQCFSTMRQTYIQIERELLIQRMEQIGRTNEQNLFLCNECSNKTAVFECINENCDQNYCLECFQSYHNYREYMENKQKPTQDQKVYKNHKMLHEVKLLVQNLDFTEVLTLSHYNILNKNEVRSVKSLQSIQHQSNQNKNNTPKVLQDLKMKKGNWKKYEYFSIPTYTNSPAFKNLVYIYNLFYDEYITENGINYRDKKIDKTKILKIQKVGENQYIRKQTTSFEMITSLEDFNIEEKIFLNRLAFLTFKRNENPQLEQFLKYCKQLQEGKRFVKVMLLVDLIDEDDDKIISKEEIKKIFLTSFLQDISAQFYVENMIEEIYGTEYIIDRNILTKKLLDKKTYSSSLNSFINEVVQCDEAL